MPPITVWMRIAMGRSILSWEKRALSRPICRGSYCQPYLLPLDRNEGFFCFKQLLFLDSITNASFNISVFLFPFQSLSIHRLTPTHEAGEMVLQLLALALCHFQKDDLIVVASIILDVWQNDLKTLTAGSAFPILATFLQPELLQGSNDLLLNFLSRTFTIA